MAGTLRSSESGGVPIAHRPSSFPVMGRHPDGTEEVLDVAPAGFDDGDERGWVLTVTSRADVTPRADVRRCAEQIGRVVAFMQAIIDQMRESKAMKENRARIKILQRDIISLTDHASFLSGKISFLLDAVLGAHSHDITETPLEVAGCPIFHIGSHSRFLGQIDYDGSWRFQLLAV
mgnify:CR=1 FL=1